MAHIRDIDISKLNIDESLKPYIAEALIELDDYSHQRSDRQKRDEFVNNALSTAGDTVIRTYGDTNVIKQTLSDLGYDQLESAGAEYDE